MISELSVRVAVGSLAGEPPNWLRAGIVTDDARDIESAINPRRRRELLWSRGLKASLVAQMPEGIANRISITHDRYFTAVAVSQHSDIGIDLQTNHPVESCHKIAETWFPEAESKEIMEAENCNRFMLSWVVKEAWAKCINRSIFESCRAVAVWQDHVHIIGGAVDCPQFAWAQQYFDVNKHRNDDWCPGRPGGTRSRDFATGFTMGICLKEQAPNAPNIDCQALAPDSGLRPLSLDWTWIPVAH